MNGFRPTNPSIFFSNKDRKDQRLGEKTIRLGHDYKYEELEKTISRHRANQRVFTLAGYPDEEGVRLSSEPLGSRMGPDVIRQNFYQMAPGLLAEEKVQLIDVGNVQINCDLAHRHEHAKRMAFRVIQNGGHWLGLGGGQDYAYADAAALIETSQNHKQKPLLINFDSQLDVHSPELGLSNKTSFYRLLSDYGTSFNLACIGVHSHCNSRYHYDWARQRDVRILTFEDWLCSGKSLVTRTLDLLGDWVLTPRPTYISIDAGCFSGFAGGNLSWPTGLCANDFLQLLQILNQRLEVRSLGIYEVSPNTDIAMSTCKFAAQLLHWTVFRL